LGPNQLQISATAIPSGTVTVITKSSEEPHDGKNEKNGTERPMQAKSEATQEEENDNEKK
jgi:hypothetical protein